MITDHHGRIGKKLLEVTATTTTTTTTGIFIVRVTMGYQFVMNDRIILLYCNRNVNRTFVFLMLI